MMFNSATDGYLLNIYLCLKVCNYALYHFFFANFAHRDTY